MININQLEHIIILESIIENILNEISQQSIQFITKHDEHKIMDEINKYTNNILKANMKSLDLLKKKEIIENMSTGLFEQISESNFDYCQLGVKIGVNLILELLF